MLTRVLPADPAGIAVAADLIARGATVAVPTETVYGLAADATNEAAIAAVYAAKGRPAVNPLIVHVLDLEHAQRLGSFDTSATQLAKRHWPGPLTLVVPALPGGGIAAAVPAGLSSIALRVPAHPVMRALLMAAGRPLAAPSANASGRISPTRAEHVLRSLDARIPLVLDDGGTVVGLESTIVGATGGALRLLRAGAIEVECPVVAGRKIEAPGQMSRHYSPGLPMRLNATVPTEGEFMLGFGSIAGDITLSPTGSLDEAAANLFEALHVAEVSGRACIAVAPIPHRGIGLAINDRLRRAASGSTSG